MSSKKMLSLSTAIRKIPELALNKNNANPLLAPKKTFPLFQALNKSPSKAWNSTVKKSYVIDF